MQNEDTVKKAARAMCDRLSQAGVKVKHGQMLEAIAAGFGLDCWRELKAVIDAPRAAPVVRLAKPLGEEQEWIVEAIYADNNQQYGDRYYARTPLEACYQAMMERLTDFGLEINITSVSNADEECVYSPDYVTEVQIENNYVALKQLAEAAEQAVAAKGLDDVATSEALAWLKECLVANDPFPLPTGWESLTDYSIEESATDEEPESISDDIQMTPIQALQHLCGVVESLYANLPEMERQAESLAGVCYQVRAMCNFFEKAINDPKSSPLVL